MRFCTALCFLLALWPLQGPLADDFSISSGLDFSSGDFGDTQSTDILYAPISLRYSHGGLSVRAVLPYVSIDGPGDVLPGDGSPILTDRCARIQFTRPALFERFCAAAVEEETAASFDGSASGLGDIVLAASYTLDERLTGDFGLTFEGRVKLPTADVDKTLGTGETDANISLDAAYYGAAVTPFVQLGYRFLGDPTFTDNLGDFTVELQNGLTASAGVSVPVSDAATLTLAYDFIERSIASVEDLHELSAALSAPIGERFTLTGYGVTGLTDSSPDFALGLTLTYRFGR